MFVAWTTVATKAEADTLGREAVELGLAACVQVDGPIESFYRWDGRVEKTAEFRLCFKGVPARLGDLESFVSAKHTYAVPEWIVVRVDGVSQKYLSWAEANSSP
jgi:periplasmic divalent cation tolerance protein